MTDRQFQHWAFLSFSRQDNSESRPHDRELRRQCWGDGLLTAVKNFRVPPEFAGQPNGRGEIIPENLDAILSAESDDAAELSAESRQALKHSRCLVVICSPRSAQSRSVNEAVLYFKQLGRDKQILPIVIAGEPNIGHPQKSGLLPQEECFVPALLHPVRPDGTLDTKRRAPRFVFVDARHGVEQREILAEDNRQAETDLEMAKIQLIALLLGVGFNGLWEREQKRHFSDFTAAQRQARETLAQVEAVRRQLQEAQQQVRDAQSRALAAQNLAPDVQGQIQSAHNEAAAAQEQVRTAETRLRDAENKVRQTQAQLDEVRQRALAAEAKVQETQQRVLEFQTQLESAKYQILEAQAAKAQSVETPPQVQSAPERPQALSVSRQSSPRLVKVFAVLAALALLTAAVAVSMAWRQHKVDQLALTRATAEATGNFKLSPEELNSENIAQALEKIGGAAQLENRRFSLGQLADAIPPTEIPAALKTAAVIADDAQRRGFQQTLLMRLAQTNPEFALAVASAIAGDVETGQGKLDASSYFQFMVLSRWMRTDLTGAFRAICNLPETVVRSRALEEIIPMLIAADAQETTSHQVEGQSIPDGRMYQLLFEPTVAAVNWIESQGFSLSPSEH